MSGLRLVEALRSSTSLFQSFVEAKAEREGFTPRVLPTSHDYNSSVVARSSPLHSSSKIINLRSLIFAGGEGGVRTLDDIAAIQVFETCAINHSATSPIMYIIQP